MGEPTALSPDPADEAQSANPHCIYWRSLDPEAWPFSSAVVSFFYPIVDHCRTSLHSRDPSLADGTWDASCRAKSTDHRQALRRTD